MIICASLNVKSKSAKPSLGTSSHENNSSGTTPVTEITSNTISKVPKHVVVASSTLTQIDSGLIILVYGLLKEGIVPASASKGSK